MCPPSTRERRHEGRVIDPFMGNGTELDTALWISESSRQRDEILTYRAGQLSKMFFAPRSIWVLVEQGMIG